MATPQQFGQNMNTLALKVQGNITNAKRNIALKIQLELLHTTPVDTSQALSNWIVTLDHPTSDVIAAYSGGKDGSTSQHSTGQAYNQAQSALSDLAPGQDIYIQNNLSYISELNDGHSKQAPSGFVQTAILDAVNSIRNVSIV